MGFFTDFADKFLPSWEIWEKNVKNTLDSVKNNLKGLKPFWVEKLAGRPWRQEPEVDYLPVSFLLLDSAECRVMIL